MKQPDSVVLVDEHGHDLFSPDGRLAKIEKIEAHRRGLMHRAISVFIFNARNELLLQKRARDKYHSPNKWSNTCCTHPFPGETSLRAAQRRLLEEMGIMVTLTEVFTFSYKANVGNGLIENEFDHVFFGLSNQNPKPDSAEVSDWNWATIEVLSRGIIRNPGKYSVWFRQCFGNVVKYKLHKPRYVAGIEDMVGKFDLPI